MTDPGVATTYRYVSDGRMADGLNRDLVARVNRLLVWCGLVVAGFALGFLVALESNRESLPYYRGDVVRIAVVSGLVVAAGCALGALVGVAAGRTVNRLRMRRLFPIGSVTEVRLDNDALVLTRPRATRTIPHDRIRRVRMHRHTHWLIVRGRPNIEVLPPALLPGEAVEVLRARASGATPASWSPSPTGPTRQMVVPDGWAAHVAAETVWDTIGKPRFWVRVGLAILVSALTAYAAGIAWLALGPVIATVALGIAYVRTRRAMVAAMPRGSAASVEVLDDRMVSRTARWTREIRFDEVRDVDVRTDVVFLTMTSAPRRLALARELVSDALIRRLQARRPF